MAQLRALERGEERRVGVVQLGASHTARQKFTDQMRARLRERFGVLGQGFVPAAPTPSSADQELVPTRTGAWEIETALHSRPWQPWSISGSRLAGRAGAQLSVSVCSGCEDDGAAARMQVFYREQGGSRLEALLDGQRVLLRSRRYRGTATRIAALETTATPRRLDLRVSGRAGLVHLFGLTFERLGAGVVYDALGLSGSSAGVAARYARASFIEQVRARDPRLVVLFFGTNESVMESFDEGAYVSDYEGLVRTLQQAAPSADCLLMGPTDRWTRRGDAYEPAPHTLLVEASIRQVARTRSCAFWSPRLAMGGRGGMLRWMREEPARGHPDGTHLTELGYKSLANLLANDLLAAYDGYVLSADGVRQLTNTR